MSEQALAPAFFATNETSGESAPPPASGARIPPSGSNSSSPPISFPSPPTPSANSTSPSPVAQSPPQGTKTSPPLTFPPPSPTSSSGSDSPPPNPSPTHKSSSPPPSPPSNEPPPVSPPPPSPPPHDPVAPPALPFPPPNTNNQSSTPLTPPPTSKISPPPHSTPVTMSPPPNPLPATPSLPKLSPPAQVVIPPVPQTPPSTTPSPPLPLSPPNPSTPIINPPNQTTPVEPYPSTPSDSKPPESAPSPRDADSSSSTSSSSSSSSHLTGGSWNVAIVVVAGVLAVAVVALVAIFFLVSRKKRRMNGLASQYRPPPSNFSIEPNNQYHKQSITTGHSSNSDIYYGSKPPSSPSAAGNSYGSYGGHRYHAVFTYEELMDTTNGFSHENLIGEGGFGCVYKGCLPDGRTVAVKQLKVGSGQGEKEFRAEVEIISRVHHRHLVSLVGYCISEHHRLLLYEFVPNKTLEHHLHGKGLLALDWPKRVKIAIGSARGLAYLHEDCHPRIIHRDIKSANILLDNSFEAQVADFGLAKLTNDAHTHVSTRVMGTFGCMAPEYASSGKLTDRSDVFSFGVVLLELITGRKPVDPSQPFGNESLVEWARPLLIRALDIGDYEELVDPRLENNFARSEMLRMIEVATACVRHSAPKRPRMVQVLRALDSEGDLADLSNGVKFGQSVVYDSSQYSADILNFRRLAFESEEYSSDRTHSGSTAYSGTSQSKEAPYMQLGTWRPGELTSGYLQPCFDE